MTRWTRVAAYAYPPFDEQSGRRHGAPIALLNNGPSIWDRPGERRTPQTRV